MTNPTPLTADAVWQYIAYCTREPDAVEYEDLHPILREQDMTLGDAIKTYAAQQNSELVAEANKDNVLIAQLHEEVADLQAENERLKTAEQSYCRRISLFEKDIKSLQRSAAIRDTKLAKAKAHTDLMQAENERLKQQLTWQSIKAAPKDGTSVLIFDNYREDKKVDGYNRVVARFDEPLDRWMIHQRYGNYIACVNPTHWMPLPQPPKEAT